MLRHSFTEVDDETDEEEKELSDALEEALIHITDVIDNSEVPPTQKVKIESQHISVAFIGSKNENSSLHALTSSINYEEKFFVVTIDKLCARDSSGGNKHNLQY